MLYFRALILASIALIGVVAVPEGWVAKFSEGVRNLASGKTTTLAPYFVHNGRFCVNAVCGGYSYCILPLCIVLIVNLMPGATQLDDLRGELDFTLKPLQIVEEGEKDINILQSNLILTLYNGDR